MESVEKCKTLTYLNLMDSRFKFFEGLKTYKTMDKVIVNNAVNLEEFYISLKAKHKNENFYSFTNDLNTAKMLEDLKLKLPKLKNMRYW